MTSKVSPVSDRPVIGTRRMPATAASALPTAQFTAATRAGDTPSAPAVTSLSATAVLARPKRVYR
jgi:hypothetical protein